MDPKILLAIQLLSRHLKGAMAALDELLRLAQQ